MLAFLVFIVGAGVYSFFYIAGSAWRRANKKKRDEVRDFMGDKQGTYYPPGEK